MATADDSAAAQPAHAPTGPSASSYEPLPASMSTRAQEVLRAFGGPRAAPPPAPADPAAAAAALQARRADVLASTSELSARYDLVYLDSVKEVSLGGVPAVELVPRPGVGADGKPRTTGTITSSSSNSSSSSSSSAGQAAIAGGQTAGGGTVLYFHGGALMVGCPMAQRHAYAPLAAAAGVRVVAVGYRLAPEHSYPAALEDAAAAYTALLTSTPPNKIVLAGDSAGGNLAAALLLWIATKSELPLPAAAVLFSPWACLDNARVDTRATLRGSDPFLCPEMLRDAAAAYAFGLGGSPDAAAGSAARLRDPLASPALADWRAAAAAAAAGGRGGLPPVLAFAGTREIVLGDSGMLTRGLRRAGADARLSVTDGGWHGMVFGPPGPLEVPEAAEVHEEAAAFIRRCISD